MNQQIHSAQIVNYGFSNNDTFRHLLQLTRLDTDLPTLITLFKEQGIDICERRIQIWSTPLARHGKPIPPIIFKGFMNLLDSINREAKQKEINLFDLSGILEDIRDEKSS